MTKARASLLSGLTRDKPTTNLAAVGEAPMELTQPEAKVEQPTPAPEKVATPAPQTAEPESVVEPAPQEVQQIVISSPQAALLPPQDVIQPVVINAPVHPRKAKSTYSRLSVQLSNERLERFEEARFRTGLTGQNMMEEALDIWLAHNGF